MIRAVLYTLIGIVAITFVRMAIGIIMRGFSDLMKEEASGSASAPPPSPKMPGGGEMKACAACGTYVLATRALTATKKGHTVHYCSDDCRRKAE